ncbi:MAG: glycoside hydrolase family 3 C-terminal domain-containing protein [Pseudomonadota bacterium]
MEDGFGSAGARDQRVGELLDAMTLAEKVSLLAGQDFWTLPAIPRLGIRSLRLSDGPTGLRSSNSDPATVFPVGVALASTWNRALVGKVAAAIGREAVAHGVNVLLAPGVNIQRTPLGGRNFEYYSEDPLLTSELGIAYVDGVQSEGVGTSVKHYVANNQEHLRMSGSSNLNARVLREIYLAAFEPIITRAAPWTVMSAYNRINGVFASEHDELLNRVLKDEWGFDGVVVSDWGAAKSTAGSANFGLDLEMPGPPRFYGNALLAAVEAGEVSQAVIDDHTARVLDLIIKCGAIDDETGSVPGWAPSDAHRGVARKAAAESMVLLKNDGDLLPLAGPQSIAVIGALADYPAIQGGGSSQVSPDRIVTPLEGLRDALGASADVHFERGVDPEPRPPVLDGRLLAPSEGANENGLKATYFDRADFSGEQVLETVDWRFSKLGFGEAAQSDNDLSFSAEWTGVFTPRHSGQHDWLVTHSNPDVELYIGDEELVGPNTSRETELLFMILPLNRRHASIHLEAGKSYPMRIRYSQPAENAIRAFNIFNIFLREPAPDTAAAIARAMESDIALVFVGSGTTSETEGKDRASMSVSEAQNQLVDSVLEANPNTVIVVNTGGPVEMPWADRAPAIVQMFLPGQEGGHGLADTLTGKTNPSGKLPVSFPRHYRDNPTYLHFPGGQDVDYGEGLFVGYRYYDAVDIAPLFPFGHGLSYTRFDYGALSGPSQAKAGDTITVSLDITNSGPVAGAEAVQIYVEDLATQETKALRQLRAFDKVELAPGETRTVSFALPRRAFAWWDRILSDWQITAGRYRIHAAASSRDLRQSLDLDLTE